MCLFSGTRRFTLPHSSGLISVWPLGRVKCVRIVGTVKEVILGRFFRIAARNVWVGAYDGEIGHC